MGQRIDWTEMDAALLKLRAEGASWDEVSAELGVHNKSAIRRAKALGLPTGRINIGPVPGRAVVAGREAPRYSTSSKWGVIPAPAAAAAAVAS
jgi:hypothetical protein